MINGHFKLVIGREICATEALGAKMEALFELLCGSVPA
jgi:hypothetical protein